MTTDAKLDVDDQDALEFLERMLIKHKVVRDLLENIFVEQDRRGEFAGFESDDSHCDSIVKH